MQSLIKFISRAAFEAVWFTTMGLIGLGIGVIFDLCPRLW